MGNGSNKDKRNAGLIFVHGTPVPAFKESDADNLVYSTDPPKPQNLAARCSGCTRVQAECVCKVNRKALVSGKIHARIERQGRGGKTVTIIEKFAPYAALLDELCSVLKKRLGTGGSAVITAGVGRIEIQGERVDTALAAVHAWIDE